MEAAALEAEGEQKSMLQAELQSICTPMCAAGERVTSICAAASLLHCAGEYKAALASERAERLGGVKEGGVKKREGKESGRKEKKASKDKEKKRKRSKDKKKVCGKGVLDPAGFALVAVAGMLCPEFERMTHPTHLAQLQKSKKSSKDKRSKDKKKKRRHSSSSSSSGSDSDSSSSGMSDKDYGGMGSPVRLSKFLNA
jgi:hypothetical protein